VNLTGRFGAVVASCGDNGLLWSAEKAFEIVSARVAACLLEQKKRAQPCGGVPRHLNLDEVEGLPRNIFVAVS
jgi:hypothetical protein